MPTSLIALAGNMGCGKNTVAKMIIEEQALHCKDWAEYAFATPMKEACRDIFGFTQEQLYGPSEARNAPDARYTRPDGTPLTPRYALQTMGTEWGRNCDPDLWVKAGLRQVKKLLEYHHGVVITDCRFVNEAKAVRAAGGRVWRIYRGEATVAAHQSEIELNSKAFDAEVTQLIANHDSLEGLRDTVRWLLDRDRR